MFDHLAERVVDVELEGGGLFGGVRVVQVLDFDSGDGAGRDGSYRNGGEEDRMVIRQIIARNCLGGAQHAKRVTFLRCNRSWQTNFDVAVARQYILIVQRESERCWIVVHHIR